jgi:branched-chain amino acid transport system substrate-binding protein
LIYVGKDERILGMQKKILALVIALVILTSTGVTVGLTNAAESTPRSILVGLVAPVTKSPVGQDMYRAAQLAVQEINDAGGVYVSSWGQKVNMTIDLADTIDDSPGNAVTPVTRAVTMDGVDLLIGGYASAGTLANEVVAIENRVPYIITGASSQLVTRRGPQANYGGLNESDPQRITDAEGMGYVFHYCTTTYDYSKTVVDFFATVMKPMVAPDRDFRLALVYRNDAFGKGVAAASKYWIANESLPISVVFDQAYPTDTTDFQTLLTSAKGNSPDAVFIAENPDKTPTVITQGITQVGLNVAYIAVENNQDPVFYQLLGANGNNVLLESKMDPFMNPSYLPMIPVFVQNYNATFGLIPGMMGADTYDAFYIAKAAIESAGTVDKAAVRTAIEQTNIDDILILTSTGKIQFSTGLNWHEISPVTFIEQLKYNATIGQCRSVIVWPESVQGVGTIKQADFVLPGATSTPSTSETPTQTAEPTGTPGGTLSTDNTMMYVAVGVAVVVVVVVLVAFLMVRKRKKAA